MSGLQLRANSALNLIKAVRSAATGSRFPVEPTPGGQLFSSFLSTNESGNSRSLAASNQLRAVAIDSGVQEETPEDSELAPTSDVGRTALYAYRTGDYTP